MKTVGAKKVTITEFRKHPDKVLKLAEHHGTVQITSRGKPKFVLHKADVEKVRAELRKKIKAYSMNPDDYEIWEDYCDLRVAEEPFGYGNQADLLKQAQIAISLLVWSIL